jgi:hypothetical protein
MSARNQDTQKHSKQAETTQPKSAHAAGQSETRPHSMREKDNAVRHADEPAQKDKDARPDRTGGQSRTVDAKRNDEQQYHAGGVAHDPHSRTQERVNSGDPVAGDVDEETRSENAPFNKTYGNHE